MKKVFLATMFLLVTLLAVTSLQAYTVNDMNNDAIGVLTFESFGINVYNYTPGVYNGSIAFDLFTNYPQAGLTVGAWNTQPADFFIKENYHGNDYLWALPLVNHGSFYAGNMYAVGTDKISDNFDPGGGYVYNHNIPVQIATLGNNYGYSSFGGGSVVWNSLLSGSPDYRIRVQTGIWQDDPNGTFNYTWGTATCANDVVSSSPVPEPGSMMLLGTGLIGMIGFARHGIGKKQT